MLMKWMLAGSTWEGEFEMLSFIVKVGGGGGVGGGKVFNWHTIMFNTLT